MKSPLNPANKANSARPLRQVVIDLLSKSKQPLTGTELAAQAQAAGYRSKSNNFSQVVSVMLSRMDNIENVPGRGYGEAIAAFGQTPVPERPSDRDLIVRIRLKQVARWRLSSPSAPSSGTWPRRGG